MRGHLGVKPKGLAEFLCDLGRSSACRQSGRAKNEDGGPQISPLRPPSAFDQQFGIPAGRDEAVLVEPEPEAAEPVEPELAVPELPEVPAPTVPPVLPVDDPLAEVWLRSRAMLVLVSQQ
jgi:hypothetical protein